MNFNAKGMLETPDHQWRENKKEAELPWQSELEGTIRWAIFKHLDFFFFFPWESDLGYTAKWFG